MLKCVSVDIDAKSAKTVELMHYKSKSQKSDIFFEKALDKSAITDYNIIVIGNNRLQIKIPLIIRGRKAAINANGGRARHEQE